MLTGPNISVEKVLIEPVIAYIVFSMQSGTFDNIKNATLGAFTEAEISSAKDDLWTHCGSRIIGEKKRRKETSARTIKEANIIDIMQAISQLDKSDSLPNVAINARSLQFIPRSHPEELNNISLVDRLNRLEARMMNMQTQLDGVTAHNMFLRDKLLDKSSYASKVSSNAIVYAATSTAPAIPVNTSIGNNKSGSLDVRPKIPNLPSLASNQQSTISTSLSSKPKDDVEASYALPRQLSYLNQDSDSSFRIPTQQLKQLQRKERRQAIIGKGNVTANLKGGPEPGHDIFVFRLDPSSTKADVESFLETENVEVWHIEQMSHESAKYKSFKVTIPTSKLQQLLNEEAWPEGIGVRRFCNAKKQAIGLE